MSAPDVDVSDGSTEATFESLLDAIDLASGQDRRSWVTGPDGRRLARIVTVEDGEYLDRHDLLQAGLDIPARDALIKDLACLIAGLGVPVSMRMPLGTARDPWIAVHTRLVAFGWANSEQYEQALRKILVPAEGEPVPPQLITWDWKEQPSLSEVATALAGVSGGRVHLRAVDTQSDQYAWIVSGQPVADAEAEAILYPEEDDSGHTA